MLQALDPVQDCFLVAMIVSPAPHLLLLVGDHEAMAVGALVLLELLDIQPSKGYHVRGNLLLLILVNK